MGNKESPANNSLQRLINLLTLLPNIGRKTAQRIAFHILTNPELGKELNQVLSEALARLRLCPHCFNLTEGEICAICADPRRERSVICVVEEPADILAVEQTGKHRGTYYVLGGVLSPVDNIGPDDLRIKGLITRVKEEKITEVIVATNPTTEGEASAIYLANHLKPLGIRVTRIAHGLPVGSDIVLADQETLSRALEGRREM